MKRSEKIEKNDSTAPNVALHVASHVSPHTDTQQGNHHTQPAAEPSQSTPHHLVNEAPHPNPSPDHNSSHNAHDAADEADTLASTPHPSAGTEHQQNATTNATKETPTIKELSRALALKEQEYQELYNQHLREKADLANYRQRLEREKREETAYANRQLLLDTIGILDNFERAIEAYSNQQSTSIALIDGIALIQKEWINMLAKKWGLTQMNSVGEVFDPNIHEAVAMEEHEGIEQQTIVEEFQRGYLLHQKVLRSAKVKVHVPTRGPKEK